MKNLSFIVLLTFLITSCSSQEELNDVNNLTFIELESLVLESTEYEDVITAADLLHESSPSPLDIEARREWNQIFIDFHNEVGDDQYFSYYIDNPKFETPEEVKEHYILLIDFQEKVDILKEKFNLSKHQFSEIFIGNRVLYNYKN